MSRGRLHVDGSLGGFHLRRGLCAGRLLERVGAIGDGPSSRHVRDLNGGPLWALRGGLWCVNWGVVGGIIGSVVGCRFLEWAIFALVEVVVFGIFVHLVSIYWDVLGEGGIANRLC